MSRKQENLKGGQDRGEDSGNRGIVLVLGAVLVVGVIILGYSLLGGLFAGAATEPVELDYADDPDRLIEAAQGVEMGDSDAPVTMLEFADYQCPGCADFATRIKPQLREDFIETGELRFVLHDFPLGQHGNAFLAARAARCAGDQDRYWEYHDVLAARRDHWANQDDPRGLFTDYAGEVGTDESAFRDCLNSDRHAETVTANAHLGRELGVTGTPTILVHSGGSPERVDEWSNYEAISTVIEDALGEGEAAGEGDEAQQGG